MLQTIARSWWTFLLRGILAIAFGLLAFANPLLAGLSLVLVFGAWVLADGIFSLAAAFHGRRSAGHILWLVIIGIVGIAAGVFFFARPGLAMAVVIYWIGWWAICRGIFEIIAAISLRRQIANEWALVLGGVCSVVFGVLVVFSPFAAGIGLIWIAGIYAILVGLFFVVLSLRLRRFARNGAVSTT
ncbi:hypothetical protein OpiT1DRAFT_03927 [Opitutaceae bacterium TAV1]|nr:hypothetical protein OpiT1DRAFT_03927 [Opitutaceae bacterium TAV1]